MRHQGRDLYDDDSLTGNEDVGNLTDLKFSKKAHNMNPTHMKERKVNKILILGDREDDDDDLRLCFMVSFVLHVLLED